MLERAFNMATAASYAPMLAKMPEVLFGNPQEFLKETLEDMNSISIELSM